MAYVTKSHGVLVQSIYDTADTSKKKRKRTVLPDTTQGHPDAIALKDKLEHIMLKCWPCVILMLITGCSLNSIGPT